MAEERSILYGSIERWHPQTHPRRHRRGCCNQRKIRDNVTLHIVTDEDDEEKPEDGGDESEAAPQGDLMDAVDSMDDEQLTALKARIQAAEAARAEKNETPKESSSDENTEG